MTCRNCKVIIFSTKGVVTLMEKQWRCTVCGYIHNGENPPEICPICGVDASFFELITQSDEPKIATNIKSVAKPVMEQPDNEKAIRQALYRISYGLYIITSQAEGRDNGQCANTCFQITSDPARLAIGINKLNFTHELIQKTWEVWRFSAKSNRPGLTHDGLDINRVGMLISLKA